MRSKEVLMKALALIAHDHKKADLVAWATFNRDTLARFRLLATSHTARLMQDKVGLTVEQLLSGPQGGDAQIAALAATGQVDAVYFFVDPLSAQPHDPDIRALLRVCNVHNVPLATNLATADLVMAALADERVRPASAWASPD
jgi:methylglyoxal synthase